MNFLTKNANIILAIFILIGTSLQFFSSAPLIAAAPQKLIISVPFADLRADPTGMPPNLQGPAFSQDVVAQISQILFGEKLIVNNNEAASNTTPLVNWIPCLAVEQEVITTGTQELLPSEKKWQGCPGYVQQDQVMLVQDFPHYNVVLQDLWTSVYAEKNIATSPRFSLACGTMLTAHKEADGWWHVYLADKEVGFIPASATVYELSPVVKESAEDLRVAIIALAKKFVGTPYVWGGRTPLSPTTIKALSYLTGIDCSDFMNLVFKAIGLQIPKNSTSQFYGLPKIIKHGKDLLPGDLIFFTRKNDITAMCHVMMYLGKDAQGKGLIIESTGRGISSIQEAISNGINPKDIGVRIIKLIDYLGVDVDQLEAGKTKYEKRDYFVLMGSYLNSQEVIQGLRTKLLE